jgi:hypothetical protein
MSKFASPSLTFVVVEKWIVYDEEFAWCTQKRQIKWSHACVSYSKYTSLHFSMAAATYK